MSVPTPGSSGTSTIDAARKAPANRWLVLAIVALKRGM